VQPYAKYMITAIIQLNRDPYMTIGMIDMYAASCMATIMYMMFIL